MTVAELRILLSRFHPDLEVGVLNTGATEPPEGGDIVGEQYFEDEDGKGQLMLLADFEPKYLRRIK